MKNLRLATILVFAVCAFSLPAVAQTAAYTTCVETTVYGSSERATCCARLSDPNERFLCPSYIIRQMQSHLLAWVGSDCKPVTVSPGSARFPRDPGQNQSTVCTVYIEGWERNTSKRVQVCLPDQIDAWGGHANGIVVFPATTDQDVANMSGFRSGWPDAQPKRQGEEVYAWNLYFSARVGATGGAIEIIVDQPAVCGGRGHVGGVHLRVPVKVGAGNMGGPVELQAMTNWASGYPTFFGTAVAGSFVPYYTAWSTAQWAVSYAVFNLINGGTTWVILITNKADGRRYIEYYNPFLGEWIGWFQV